MADITGIIDIRELEQMAKAVGFSNIALLSMDKIIFDPAFRMACKQNRCGNYGKNWTCPPEVGEIEVLINKAKTYKAAIILQTITKLKSCFDFKGMEDAAKVHQEQTNLLVKQLNSHFQELLPLAVGGCGICKKCAKRTGEPCRFPDQALASVEAYGMDVMRLAKQCDLEYYNGEETVTLFGAILFNI